MKIREERARDAESVAEVHREAFGDHGVVVAGLVEELRPTASGGEGLSLVAEHEGGVVGHALFSPGLLDAPTRLVTVEILSPLGVRPALQGKGIASALVRRGLEVLGVRRVPAVFVEGDPDYYGRLGFVSAGPLGFRKPSLRIPDIAFQVITLVAYESWMVGTLVYPDAFWRHDAVGLRASSPDAGPA